MTLPIVLDRIHEINGKITVTDEDDNPVTVHTSRTYPTTLTTNNLPMITAVPAPGQFSTPWGNADDYTIVQEDAQIEIIVFTTNYYADANHGGAQLLAEKLMQSVKQVYWARPRLELDGGDELSCMVENARLNNRASITQFNNLVLEIVFTLNVPFEEKIERV